MSKLLIIVAIVGVIAASIVVWKLVEGGSVVLSPTPSSLAVPAGVTTTDMMVTLGATNDDEGKSELMQLDQEVNQL